MSVRIPPEWTGKPENNPWKIGTKANIRARIKAQFKEMKENSP